MAKTMLLKSKNPLARERPTVCLIPGGPGLSSATLRSMDVLSRSFNLAYVDPPGTGGQPEVSDPTFISIVAALEDALKPLGRIILCGHSFGGIYAARLAVSSRLDVTGLVLIAAPLTAGEFEYAVKVFSEKQTPKLAEAERRWAANSTRENFQEWLACYDSLYFVPDNIRAGQEMLRNDLLSTETFLKVHAPQVLAENDLLEPLSRFPARKLWLAGSEDLFFPAESLVRSAAKIGAELYTISGASHFVTFDQPESVARLIEEAFCDDVRKSL